MASSAASQADATITFSSSFFAQIIDIAWGAISRASIDTSYQGLAAAGAGKFGNKTFIASNLVDPGELTVTFNFNPDTLPPIGSASETVTVAMSDSSSQATWAGTGFMTAFSFDGPLEDRMVGTATIKFSGNITRTAGT